MSSDVALKSHFPILLALQITPLTLGKFLYF